MSDRAESKGENAVIHVLCLNPAIDKMYEIDGFAAGGVYPGQRPRVSVGGKGINVARVLNQLGEAPRLYAMLGETGGDAVRREMEPRCACHFVSVAGACRTTVNIMDRASGRETAISEAGPRAEREQTDALLRELFASVAAGDIVCCSGSIIPGAPADIYARVSRLCEEKGARCALDCNAASLGASLSGARYALGKPNEDELTAYLGVPRTQDARKIASLASRLLPEYGALLVSLGAKGGVLVTSEGALAADALPVEVRTTVGCGDASFAGALFALARGMDGESLLRIAMACGAANAAGGLAGSVDAGLVETLARQVNVRAL